MPQFDGMADFMRFLGSLPFNIAAAEHAGRHAAVGVLKKEVRSLLGEYQRDDTGPFPAWAELADATKEHRAHGGFTENDPGLVTTSLWHAIEGEADETGRAVVGVKDAIVGTGGQNDEIRNIGDVAVAQELGTDRIPQRSFLGIGAYRAKDRIVEVFCEPVIAALSGRPKPNALPDDEEIPF